MNLNKILILLCFLVICQLRLYQVVSLSRHGARYHVSDFGNGNLTRSLWGQLSSVGMRQHQKLGKILREQYINKLNFLSHTYKRQQIQVYSTPSNRTILSIQSQLYGLYPLINEERPGHIDKSMLLPPYNNKKYNQSSRDMTPKVYQPIPIKINPKIMLNDCPNYYGKFWGPNFDMNANMVKQMNRTYGQFIRKIAIMFGEPANSGAWHSPSATFGTMLRVWDVINVNNHYGFPIPGNLNAEDQDKVHHIANWYYMITSLNSNSVMLSSGKLLKILHDFDLRIQLPYAYPHKWTFLSGHDTDLFALYVALKLSSPECLEQKYRKGKTSALNCQDGANHFAASLIFELHSDDEKSFYVKIRSNGKYVKLCGKNLTQCEYNEFKALAKKSIVTNIDDICGKKVIGQQIGLSEFCKLKMLDLLLKQSYKQDQNLL